MINNKNITLTEEQEKGFELCMSDKSIIAIAGRAGTGKTSLITAIGTAMTEQCMSVAFCSPTGKAARRARQVTGFPFITIHKLLEYSSPELDEEGYPVSNSFPNRNAFNKLEYDCIIIDEAGTMSAELWNNLRQALPRTAYVRMFGDIAQLQPIEPKTNIPEQNLSVFMTLVNNIPKTGNGIILTKIWRQDAQSGIIKCASKIADGLHPENLPDFKLRPTINIQKSLETFITPYYIRIDHQVITPSNVGPFGTHAVNKFIQRMLNPDGDALPIRGKTAKKEALALRIGDKVIMTKNWYGLGTNGVMNGDLGTVTGFDDKRSVIIAFDHETVSIPTKATIIVNSRKVIANPQTNLELAYAITTHKSQGSEFEEVIYTFDTSQYGLLNRANFYTAVTRAKKAVTIIYKNAAMNANLRKAF